MNHYILHGCHRETGATLNIKNLAAETHDDAFIKAQAAFPAYWFYYCHLCKKASGLDKEK